MNRATSQSLTCSTMESMSPRPSGRRISLSVTSSTAVVGIDLDIAMGEVAGPDPRAGLADSHIHFDMHIATLDMGGDRRFRRSRRGAGPLRATTTPPILICSLSWSARSPDLPTASDDASPLASSPAMAVLTNGELAMARPIFRAARGRGGAGHVDGDQLLRASPSCTTCTARSVSSE